MNLDFPFQIDARGRTAAADDAEYVRDLIEQILFTSPRERVNRPQFGCGVAQLVFAPNAAELATASQSLIQASLQQHLAGLVTLQRVAVTNNDETLEITIEYVRSGAADVQTAVFSRET